MKAAIRFVIALPWVLATAVMLPAAFLVAAYRCAEELLGEFAEWAWEDEE